MRNRSLQQYLESQVSKEDFEGIDETAAPVEPTDEELVAEPVAEDVVEEAELEIPAVPDEEIEAEEVEEADEEIEDAVEEDAELDEDIEEAEAVQDDVQEEVESIEHFIVTLEHGIKRKSFSPQFAAIVSSKLTSLEKTFGDKAAAVPSLESYGNDSLEGYYEASLESFRGFVKRLVDVGERVTDWLADLASNGQLVNGYKKRAAALNKQIDAQLQAISGGSVVVSESPVKVPKALAGADGDLLGAINADLRLTTAVATKGLKANQQLLTSGLNVLNEAVAEGGKGKTGAIVAKAAQLAPAVAAYPEEAFSKGFLGGKVLTKKEGAGGEDTRSKLKALQGGGIPEVKGQKAQRPAEATLSKQQVAQVLKLAKVFVGVAEKATDNNGAQALQSFHNTRRSVDRAYGGVGHMGGNMGANPTTWSEGKDLDALAVALPKLVHRHIQVYRFTADHALNMAKALVELADKATNKGEVSQEGFLGGLAGFIGTSAVGAAIPFVGGAAVGAAAKAQIQKTQQDIRIISERIAKLRNGEIDEMVKQGKELPKGVKKIDGGDVAKGAVLGMLFGPFYGAYKGSQIQNEYGKLQDKIKELEVELERAGIKTTEDEVVK